MYFIIFNLFCLIMGLCDNLLCEIFQYLCFDQIKEIIKYSKKLQNMINLPKYLYFFSDEKINAQIINLFKNTFINKSINNYFIYLNKKITNKIDKKYFYKLILEYNKYYPINIILNTDNDIEILKYINQNLNIIIEQIPIIIPELYPIKLQFSKNLNSIEDKSTNKIKGFLNHINFKYLEEIIIENTNNTLIINYLLEKETPKLKSLKILNVEDSIETHEKILKIVEKNKNNLIKLNYKTFNKLINKFEKIYKSLNQIKEIYIGKIDYTFNCLSNILFNITNISFENPNYYLKDEEKNTNIKLSNFINQRNNIKSEKILNPFLKIKEPPSSIMNLKIINFNFTENTNYSYYLNLIKQNQQLEEINVILSKYLPLKIKELFFNIINNLSNIKIFSILDGKNIKYLKNKTLTKITIDKVIDNNLNLLFENCPNINSMIITRSNLTNINKNNNKIKELIIYNKEIKINLNILIWIFSQYELKKLEINLLDFEEEIEDEVFEILKKFIKEIDKYNNLHTCILIINDLGNDKKKQIIKYLTQEFSKIPYKTLKISNQIFV